MAVHAFASLAGSPGVTTAALSFAVHWPRPVIVFEAETDNATSAMTGFLRSNLHPSIGGLDKVSVAYSRNVLTWQDLITPDHGLSIAVHDLPPLEQPIPSLPPGHRMWIVPGFHKLGIVNGVRRMWARFPHLIRSLSEAGIDVIVDLGRITNDDVRLPILDGADRVTFFSTNTMVDLNRMYRRAELPDFADRFEGLGRAQKYRLMLVNSRHESIPTVDFSRNVLPVLTELPFDPDGAAVFALGKPDTRPTRNTYRNAVRRAVATLDAATDADLDRKEVG